MQIACAGCFGEFGPLQTVDLGKPGSTGTNWWAEALSSMVGVSVTFVAKLGEKGTQASTVKPMGRHSLRLREKVVA